MQIWLETTDIPLIEKAQRMGILYGIMTTPAVLAPNPKEILSTLLSAQQGPVAIEVRTADQAKALYNHSHRIMMKVPATEQGWETMHILSKAQIPVIASAIFHPRQALIAALAGANYVAPYFSRILKTGDNPLSQIEAIQKMAAHYQMKTKVMAIHPKTVEQIKSCAEIGIEAIALHDDVFKDLIETHELTAGAVEQFDDDWKKIESQGWF